MPAEIVFEQPEVFAEVVSIGLGEDGSIDIQNNPIDDALLTGLSAFGLPALMHPESCGHHVVDHFRRGRGHPVLHAGSKRIQPWIQIRSVRS